MAVPAVSSWPKSMSGSSLQPWNTDAAGEEADGAEEDVLVARHLRPGRAHLVQPDRGDHDARAEDRARAEVDVHQRAHGDGRAAGRTAASPRPGGGRREARGASLPAQGRAGRERARARARAEPALRARVGRERAPRKRSHGDSHCGAPRIMREKKGTSPLFRGVGVAAESFNRTRNRPSCRRIYCSHFFFRFPSLRRVFHRRTPHASLLLASRWTMTTA